MGTVHRHRVKNVTFRHGIVKKKLETSTGELHLRIKDFPASLLFHRKITAVPFTPHRGYGKQTRMAGTDQTIGNSHHARRQTSRLIAIIDDDKSMQDSLRDLIESTGLVAWCFGSAEEFLESGLHREVGCLIAEFQMPGMSGLELQARLKVEQCNIPIIFIVSNGAARMRIQAMREGAVEFLAKPLDHQLLLETVRAALDM
jgi:CheY-like chemotaxis protein